MKRYITLLLSCLLLLVATSVSARGNSPGNKESKIELSKTILSVDAVLATPVNLANYQEIVRSDQYSKSENSTTVKNEKEKTQKEFAASAFLFIERRRQQHFDYGVYLIDKPVKMGKLINAPPYCNINQA